MGHLKRDDMRPLAPGFAEAYRNYYESIVHTERRNNKPLEGTSPEVFKKALESAGIDSSKTLAEIIGKSRRTAQSIIADPSKMRANSYNKLRLWIESRLRELELESDCLSQRNAELRDYHAITEAEELEETEALRTCRSFEKGVGPLFDTKPLRQLERAISDESGARYLVEAYLSLDGDSRKAIVRAARGILKTAPNRKGYRNDFIADSCYELFRRSRTTQQRLDALATLVSKPSEELEHMQLEDERMSEHTGEEYDFYSSAVLDEYTRLRDPEQIS